MIKKLINYFTAPKKWYDCFEYHYDIQSAQGLKKKYHNEYIDWMCNEFPNTWVILVTHTLFADDTRIEWANVKVNKYYKVWPRLYIEDLDLLYRLN